MEGKKRIEKEEEKYVEINRHKNFDVEAPPIPGREEEKEEKDATMIKKKTSLRYSSYAEKGIESSTRSVERVSIEDMEAIKVKEKEIKSSVQLRSGGRTTLEEMEGATQKEMFSYNRSNSAPTTTVLSSLPRRGEKKSNDFIITFTTWCYEGRV